MLEYLRNAADKPVAKILIGILMFSFVGWGVAEWIFGNVVGDSVLVRVGNAKITAAEFSNARSQELSQLSKEQQRAVYNDAASGNAFSERVLAKMGTEKMTLNRANDLGFMVSDNRIAREIREFPEFQYNGKFSTAMFDMVLRNSGYSEAQFADIMRSQVLRTMVLGALNVPVPVPEFAVDAAYNARYGMRDIEYTTVKLSDFKIEKPSEEQLRDFYAQNPHVVEETRDISYVLVPAKMTQPDAYDAALTTAQRIEDDIIAGETLANAASNHKARFVAHKNMSAAHRPVDTILTDEIVAKIFAMDEGTESALIETSSGFVIIRVDSVNPRHNAEFDAVKSSLTADWTRAQQRRQAYIRANELMGDVRGGKSVAGSRRVRVSRASGAPINVLTAAYKVGTDTIQIVEDGDAFYVLNIRDTIAPTVDAAKKKALRTEITNMSARSVADDYNSFLGRTYPVKINEKVYSKVFAK